MDVVYICLNNWTRGVDYPDSDKFEELVNGVDSPLWNDAWHRERSICCRMFPYDMSVTWLLTAPRGWAEENWPELSGEWRKFLAEPDDDGGAPESRFGVPFREWSESALGLERAGDPCRDDGETDG